MEPVHYMQLLTTEQTSNIRARNIKLMLYSHVSSSDYHIFALSFFVTTKWD